MTSTTEASRCDADSTPVADVTKPGPIIKGVDCLDNRILVDRKRLCKEALKEVRANCSKACETFSKINEGEGPTTRDCARDKQSKTTATPNCTETKVNSDPPQAVAAASCKASIACQCDP